MSDRQTEQLYVDDEISQLVTDIIPKPKRIKTRIQSFANFGKFYK